MGFSEHLAESVSSSRLQSHPDKIRDIEFVAALSSASHIGSDMMRAKDYDLSALRRAISRLSVMVSKKTRISLSISQLLATTAIFELMHWQCRQCHGASEQIISGIRVTCPSCGGTGIHRWGNAERARAAGFQVEEWGRWSRKYEQVLQMARNHDINTEFAARKRLG